VGAAHTLCKKTLVNQSGKYVSLIKIEIVVCLKIRSDCEHGKKRQGDGRGPKIFVGIALVN
jgi:hypothetical protein